MNLPHKIFKHEKRLEENLLSDQAEVKLKEIFN